LPLSKGSGLQIPWLKPKINKALDLIKQWLELCDHQVYCAVSGGKDSLVLSHLVQQVYPDCPNVWINQGPLAEWDDCIELLSTFNNLIELCPPRSLLKLYYDHGIGFESHMYGPIDKKINQDLIYKVIDQYVEQYQIKGSAVGIRAQESKARRLNLAKRGLLYKMKNGSWKCCAVGRWTTQDIWNYIDHHELVYPAIYDVDRYKVRNGPPINATGSNLGAITFLKRHYPEIYHQFVKAFPEVKDHC
jgi:3'-phosphoadenosine 5'-phosphosulfate sulfotransferase (PAPS reductase)/FAD synthetase